MGRSISLAAIVLTLSLTACFGPAAGKTALARVGFHAGESVIAALNRFEHDHGRYPAKAEELVPRYLPSLKALSFTYHGEEKRLGYYRGKDGSFSLSFEYVSGFPSSMNVCEYTSGTRNWRCWGYF